MVKTRKRRGAENASEPGNGPQRQSHTPTSVGDILAQSTPPRQGRKRPEAETEEWQVIQAYVVDLARLLGDGAPLKSSTTRAYNLFLRTGLTIGAFTSTLMKVRSLTQERSATITKTHTDGRGYTRKAKMAYFFALLEEELGLTPPDKPTRALKGKPEEKKPPANRSARPRDSDGPYGHLIER